jgi:hypothetical protein
MSEATTLCWIDIPDGWKCEIKSSLGDVRPWTPDRPIAPTYRFRAWNPRMPRDPVNDPWLLPGDYDEGTITTETARKETEWTESLRRQTERKPSKRKAKVKNSEK